MAPVGNLCDRDRIVGQLLLFHSFTKLQLDDWIGKETNKFSGLMDSDTPKRAGISYDAYYSYVELLKLLRRSYA